MLIVDDERDMLEYLERVFRTEYDVVSATDAEEALAYLSQGNFQVLVTDQKMPGMSGLELLEKIKNKYPHLIRILLTGFSNIPENIQAIQRYGIHSYVVKPIDADRLRAAVDEAIITTGRAWKK